MCAILFCRRGITWLPVVLTLCPPCLCTQNKARHLRQKWKGTNNNKKVSYLSIRLVCFSLTQYAGLLDAPFFWPQAARAPNLGFRCLQTLKGSIGRLRDVETFFSFLEWLVALVRPQIVFSRTLEKLGRTLEPCYIYFFSFSRGFYPKRFTNEDNRSNL